MGFPGEPTKMVLKVKASWICKEIERRGIASYYSADKYRPRNVVEPKRITDYCKHCFALRKAVKKWLPFARYLRATYPEAAERCGDDLQKWRKQQGLRAVHLGRIECFHHDTEVLWRHRRVAARQHVAFRRQGERVVLNKEKTIQILVDYKENFTTGGNEQGYSINEEYRLTGAVSCLGFTVRLPGHSQICLVLGE